MKHGATPTPNLSRHRTQPKPAAASNKQPKRNIKRNTEQQSNGGLMGWFTRHLQQSIGALGRLWLQPLSSFLTIMVLAIALALPAGLWVFIQNVSTIVGSWEGTTKISLYLSVDVSDARAKELAHELSGEADVAEVEYVSRAEALKEFREQSGFGSAIDLMDENPLPAVIIITPLDTRSPMPLVTAFDKLAEVDSAEVDRRWLERLSAILHLIERGITIIATMLGFAVIIIIGNTIRLDIQNRKQEIIVIKLVGGADDFIRRPFLYSGLWYGLAGACIAWCIIQITLWLFTSPTEELAQLYETQYHLIGLGFQASFVLLFGGALLGWLGALVAVSRHLQQIEPK